MIANLIFFAIFYWSFAILRLSLCIFKLNWLLLHRHPEKYKELSTIRGLGPGHCNPLRMFRFVYNTETLDDEQLLRLKKKLKGCVLQMLIGLPLLVFLIYVSVRLFP